MKTLARAALLGVAILFAGPAAASAQTLVPRPSAGTVFIPGLLLGPDRLGPFQRLCSLRSVGLVEWRANVIETVVKPEASQREAFANLQRASAQARQLVSGICSRERPHTSVAELEVMGMRLDAVMQAFKAVQPAYNAFYATLDARQKTRIDALGPQRRGWRW
jgi:hypothetical protein